MVTERKGALQATKGQDGGCGLLAGGRDGGAAASGSNANGAAFSGSRPTRTGPRATNCPALPGGGSPGSTARSDQNGGSMSSHHSGRGPAQPGQTCPQPST